MARQTFFSFHHKNDAQRAAVVRNAWVTKADRIDAGFWDAAEWEKVKLQTTSAIHAWIDRQMKGTSVTCVAIGADTSNRPHVKYEIAQSVAEKKGLFGIYVHGIKGFDKLTSAKGSNPLPYGYKTYDWINDDGYNNIGAWVEAAAKAAGR